MRFEPGHKKLPGAGRKKGQLNRTTADIKALAFKNAPEAIAILVQLMRTSAIEATRIAAARELLDRGVGKASQPITGADEGPVEIKHVVSWIRDDKPEAPLSKEQLTGQRAEDSAAWH